MSNFKFRSFGNSKQNILLCDIDECYMIKKLKQTLAEIKEIAEHPKGCCIICDRLDKILQKINEVEGDKNM
jgi:hypothetical protein